jgi:hypothetical protein
MILHKCDVCDEIKSCEEIEIDNKVYDICKGCKSDMDNTLKGKGRISTKPTIQPWVVPYYPRPWYEYPYRPYSPWITWITDGTTNDDYSDFTYTITACNSDYETKTEDLISNS